MFNIQIHFSWFYVLDIFVYCNWKMLFKAVLICSVQCKAFALIEL